MRYIIIIILLSIVFFSCEESDNLPKIGIVQLAEDPVLDMARLAAIKALEDAGYIDGKNIHIDYKNAQGEISNVIMILKSFQNSNIELLITNTTPCMSAAASNIKEIPIVFTVAFGPEQIGIKAPDNLHGYFDPLNMREFIKLINSCIPELKKIGVPYNPSEANAEYAAKRLVEACNEIGIKAITRPVNSPNDIIPAVQSLISEDVQALIATADNTTYLGLATIADLAAKSQIPLFVSDPSQVVKGAALGYGVNYEEWGKLSGEMAAEILINGKNHKPGIKPIEATRLVVNKSAAKRQGINIPDEIIKRADLIIE